MTWSLQARHAKFKSANFSPKTRIFFRDGNEVFWSNDRGLFFFIQLQQRQVRNRYTMYIEKPCQGNTFKAQLICRLTLFGRIFLDEVMAIFSRFLVLLLFFFNKYEKNIVSSQLHDQSGNFFFYSFPLFLPLYVNIFKFFLVKYNLTIDNFFLIGINYLMLQLSENVYNVFRIPNHSIANYSPKIINFFRDN